MAPGHLLVPSLIIFFINSPNSQRKLDKNLKICRQVALGVTFNFHDNGWHALLVSALNGFYQRKENEDIEEK